MSLEIFSDLVAVGLMCVFFFVSEGDSDHFVFAHEELGVGKGVLQALEVVGAHVVEGEHIEIPVLLEEGVHLLHDEFFMLTRLGLYLGQGDELVLLSERHQQL